MTDDGGVETACAATAALSSTAGTGGKDGVFSHSSRLAGEKNEDALRDILRQVRIARLAISGREDTPDITPRQLGEGLRRTSNVRPQQLTIL